MHGKQVRQRNLHRRTTRLYQLFQLRSNKEHRCTQLVSDVSVEIQLLFVQFLHRTLLYFVDLQTILYFLFMQVEPNTTCHRTQCQQYPQADSPRGFPPRRSNSQLKYRRFSPQPVVVNATNMKLIFTGRYIGIGHLPAAFQIPPAIL